MGQCHFKKKKRESSSKVVNSCMEGYSGRMIQCDQAGARAVSRNGCTQVAVGGYD